MQREIEAVLATLYNPGLKRIDLSLGRMVHFLEMLGNPQLRLPPVIHVAGTNGKGSLMAYLAAIATAAGLSVHRYISPHLVRFNERIVLAGEPVGDAVLLALLRRIQEAARHYPVTFFEATTAAAFVAFAEKPADLLLLETGMGGRFDATNVLEKPLLTAITPVSLDHTDFLGDTMEKIAFEKAGIIKPGVTCVAGPQAAQALKVIEEVAEEKNASLFRHGHEWDVEQGHYVSKKWRIPLAPGLLGEHQLLNAATAAACVECLNGLNIAPAQVARGISHAEWPARLQRLTTGRLAGLLPEGCELWLDGGHNPAAGEVLGRWAAGQGEKPLFVICGMVQGKDAAGFLAPLAPCIQELQAIAIPGEETSQPASAIAKAARAAGITAALSEGIEEALHRRVSQAKPCRILICGSLYLAGRVLALNGEQA